MTETETKQCNIEGCNKPLIARGWCGMHYRRWRIHGDPAVTKPLRRDERPCTVRGCDKPRDARGLCTTHYSRWQKHGDPLLGAWKPAPEPYEKLCEWCGKSFLVTYHFNNPKRFCDNRCSGKAWASDRPGRTMHARGYVCLWMPEHPNAEKTGYVLEHRFVMSEHLGRPLRADEHVHHKNHKRDDNRLENLEVMSPGKHSALHNPKGCVPRNPYRDSRGRFASKPLAL